MMKNSSLSISWFGKIVVLRKPEIFEEYQPEVGRIYPAEICQARNRSPFCIVDIKDKRIILRSSSGSSKETIEKTDHGIILKTDAEYMEVKDVDKCPVCGTDECSFVYIRKNEVIGCDCCVHPVDIWEIEDEEKYDENDQGI